MTAFSFKDWFLGRQVPELAEFPKDERRRIWQRFSRKSFRKWQTWVALLICPACGTLGAIIGDLKGTDFFGLPIGAGIGGAFGGAIFGWVIAKMTRTLIREEFKSSGESIVKQ